MTEYYRDLSDVTVTFKDGEVKTYRITASVGIGGYLSQQAGQSGVLSLWNRDSSTGIPIDAIRDFTIHPVPVPELEEPS